MTRAQAPPTLAMSPSLLVAATETLTFFQKPAQNEHLRLRRGTKALWLEDHDA